MNVSYKKNSGKSMRKEGGYSSEFGHNIGQNFGGIVKELQNDPRSFINEVRVLLG